MAKLSTFQIISDIRPIEAFTSGQYPEPKVRPIEKDLPTTGYYPAEVRPVEPFTPSVQPKVETRKIEKFTTGTYQNKTTRPIEPFSSGKIIATDNRTIEPFTKGHYHAQTKPIEPFTKAKYVQSKNKPVEVFTKAKYEPKYTKPIVKFTSSKYKPKFTKPYDKKEMGYITNTYKASIKKQKFSVNSVAKQITTKVDKGIRYNLNMSTGNSSDNKFNYFDRLYSVYPENELTSTCQYVFIVRPDLNLFKNGKLLELTSAQVKAKYYGNSSPSNDKLFTLLMSQNPQLFKCLSQSFSSTHDFIPYLVGRTESIQIPDYSIKDLKFTQPYTNYNLPYANNALESTTGGTFEITFREDDKYNIHKFFQAWLYYINGVTRSVFSPKTTYIKHNKIDYACSVYCITCAADAETIIHWTKYTGCFPTNVPNSDLSFNLRGTPNNKLSITFDYFLQEPINPYILVDFNKNAHVTNYKNQGYIPVYRSNVFSTIGLSKDFRNKNTKTIANHALNAKEKFSKSTRVNLGTGNGLVGSPFICRVGKQYKLRWKKTKSLLY